MIVAETRHPIMLATAMARLLKDRHPSGHCLPCDAADCCRLGGIDIYPQVFSSDALRSYADLDHYIASSKQKPCMAFAGALPCRACRSLGARNNIGFSMYEYEDIDDPDNVAQGDVIEWLPPRASAPWRIFGVVVTADCDLAWKKHDGVVSYVPAMPARDFVWHSWRPTYFEKHQPKLMIDAAKRINTWRAKHGATGEMTPSAVRDWLVRAGVEGLFDELGATDKGQRNSLSC